MYYIYHPERSDGTDFYCFKANIPSGKVVRCSQKIFLHVNRKYFLKKQKQTNNFSGVNINLIIRILTLTYHVCTQLIRENKRKFTDRSGEKKSVVDTGLNLETCIPVVSEFRRPQTNIYRYTSKCTA